MTTRHDNETYYERAINAFTTYDVNEPSKVLSFDPEAICNVPNGNLICKRRHVRRLHDGRECLDLSAERVRRLVLRPRYRLPAMPGGALPR